MGCGAGLGVGACPHLLERARCWGMVVSRRRQVLKKIRVFDVRNELGGLLGPAYGRGRSDSCAEFRGTKEPVYASRQSKLVERVVKARRPRLRAFRHPVNLVCANADQMRERLGQKQKRPATAESAGQVRLKLSRCDGRNVWPARSALDRYA